MTQDRKNYLLRELRKRRNQLDPEGIHFLIVVCLIEIISQLKHDDKEKSAIKDENRTELVSTR
jgi:hypothetical protein